MRKYSQNEIEEIIKLVKNDGVVSVPTDTVYGICARVNSSVAFSKLVEVKNRPLNKNFPVMCSNIEQIKALAFVSENAEKLIKTFMPGPITLVFNKRPNVINNGGKRATSEIGIRMAPTPFLKQLIDGIGSPIFMTSANKSGEEVCQTLDEIEKMCPSLDGIVEGNVSFGEASTIVDCTGLDFKIQRQGPISEKQIMDILK